MDGYFFTVNCSLVTSVQPAAEFQFHITPENFSESINDYVTTNTTDTEQSVTVKLNGSFIFPENGSIQVKCFVSNTNGNDSVTTSIRRCGKGTL